MMTPARAAALLAKRNKTKTSVSPTQVLNEAFAQQKSFIADPAKLKALFCTRRAAKSFTAALYLIHEALSNPGCNCLFIGLTRGSAKGILWKDCLKVLNNRLKLKATFNGTDLTMTLPNGSVIWLTGVDADEDEMNKLLGKKYKLVCIDEASVYTIDLRNLVYGILKPAMADLQGTICLMGTSSNFTRGLFYDVTTNQEAGWSLHTWTAHDNPHVSRQWKLELEDIAKNRPLFMDTPLFKQWYLNQWVVDDEKLVYKFNSDLNTYKELPKLNPDGWTYILGVDTGWEDDNAFVLCGFHENDQNLYVIKTFNRPKMTFDAVVAKIKEFLVDTNYPIAKVVIDGANKQGVESMRMREPIPFVYAEKQDKVSFIEIMNGDFIQGKVKLNPALKTLQNELMSLVWKTTGDKIDFPKKEHPSLPNHLCDALLYAWRHAYHYHGEVLKKQPAQYSKEWYDQQSNNIWEKERERLIEQASSANNWPDQGSWGNSDGFGEF